MMMGKKLKQNIFDQIHMLTPDQIAAFIEYYQNVSNKLILFLQVEHSEYLKFHSLWNIKTKRTIEEDDQEEIALTASDVEENYQEEVDIDDDIEKLYNSRDTIEERKSIPIVPESKLFTILYFNL